MRKIPVPLPPPPRISNDPSLIMLQCSQCHFKTLSLKSYVQHCQIHSNVPNANFPCEVAKCQMSFSLYSTFKWHVFRVHRGCNFMRKQVDETIKLHCNFEFCKKPNTGPKNLFSHLKEHIRKGDKQHALSVVAAKSFLSQVHLLHI